jgi:hypothetical protein
MTDRERLDRQARWQKSRKALSWPEKVRMAERARDSIKGLRGRPATRRSGPPTSRRDSRP